MDKLTIATKQTHTKNDVLFAAEKSVKSWFDNTFSCQGSFSQSVVH